jgi:hypothetical protein
LNQLFTRSLSVPPGLPLSSYQREDPIFGSSDDLNNHNSSFVHGNSAANVGLIRPASTGSVNLDSPYMQSLHQSSSFSFNSFPRHTPFGRTGGGTPPDSPPGIGIYMYICIYVYMYICIYIHKWIYLFLLDESDIYVNIFMYEYM